METLHTLLSSVSDAIQAYMGMSPAAFITILAVMVGAYLLVSSMFVAAPEVPRSMASPPLPPPEPVQIGDVTLEDLRGFDGSDPSKPLLMAIKGQIYDVSRSRMFYGPGGPYALFAGRDASRALALMSFDSNDLTGNLEGLGKAELEVLQDWEYKFMEKYVNVGQLVNESSRNREDNHISKLPEGCRELLSDAEPTKDPKTDNHISKMPEGCQERPNDAETTKDPKTENHISKMPEGCQEHPSDAEPTKDPETEDTNADVVVN